ncbi:MAG: S8 family serine peptidase [Thermoleophilia bacterium]
MLTRILIATACGVAAAAAPALAAPADGLLVRFAAGTTPTQRARILTAAGVGPGVGTGLPDTVSVRVDDGVTRRRALTALRDAGAVRWAEPPVVYRALQTPSDVLFGQQWALRNTGQTVEGVTGVAGADIGASTAWERSTGDPAVAVGVVDSGVAVDHPDLAPNSSRAVAPLDAVDGDTTPEDLEGHGTLVAGVIAARGNDGVGVTGVAWNAALVPIRVLGGGGTGTSANIAQGFRYAAQHGVRVVNASLGGPNLSQAVSDAVVQNPGTLFVVAAGNDGANVDDPASAVYPCALPAPNLICVGASTAADGLFEWSNYGAASVDLVAPGENIIGPSPAYLPPVFADSATSPIDAWAPSPGAAWGDDAVPGTGPVLSDSPGAPYASNRSDLVTMRTPMSLAGQTGCQLRMRMRISTAAGDGLIVEAAQGSSWQAIDSFSGDTRGEFRDVHASLAAFDGLTGVRLRLRFVSGPAASGDGVDISRLEVACLGGPFDATDYAVESGTSFAAPMVSGAAALILSRYPTLTPLQVKQAILEGVTHIPALAGRVVSGGRLSLPGALDAAARIAGDPVTPLQAPATSPGTQTGAGTGATPDPATQRTLQLGPPLPVPHALHAPVTRRGVWTVGVAVPGGVTARVRLQRPSTNGRPGWRTVRSVATRGGEFRVTLGRLVAGRYRVEVLFSDRHAPMRRTFRVTGGAS